MMSAHKKAFIAGNVNYDCTSFLFFNQGTAKKIDFFCQGQYRLSNHFPISNSKMGKIKTWGLLKNVERLFLGHAFLHTVV